MGITLTDEEARALKRALDIFLPELDYDVARIDRVRDRHELAQVDEVLRSLRVRLAVAEQHAGEPSLAP